ncbi:amylo-alpha-1,6-glucosidase [Vibrio sp. HN007]|uniref:amylo-alpha-1,6-glucosidase n=1 Tax=Vibrio iocasae TaxID=3098914 RepID=UPI0035D4032F
MNKVIPTLYLKGTFNGWGLDTPFKSTDKSVFETSIVLTPDAHRFKISDLDGTSKWTLSGNKEAETQASLDHVIGLTTTQGIGNDLVFAPTSTGRFILRLDIGKTPPTLTIVNESSDSGECFSRPLVDEVLTPEQIGTIDLQRADHAFSPDTLFEELAIEDKSSFPFVFGDNTDGYYEGRTHTMSESGRYRHHQGWYLGSFASFLENKENNKQHAKSARLLPFGVEHRFEDCVEQLCLIQGQRLASITVCSDTAKNLSVIPELNIPVSFSKPESQKGVLIYAVDPALCPEGCPGYIAISANQVFRAQEVNNASDNEFVSSLNLSKSNVNLILSSDSQTKNFTVYLCFEHSKEAAINSAINAVKEDARIKHQQAAYDFLTTNYLWTSDVEYNRAVMWSRLASRVFVSKEFGKGIWAGLPWFKDCWGRDTFIALSGVSLVNGLFDEAKEIIENFASMQMKDEQSVNYGRIPNRVTSKTNIIYNTTDGTPWMIREALEYIDYSGDITFAASIYPFVKRFVQGVEKYYLDSDGLITHRHPDTWMDAKIEGKIPWSPRGPKANDIQALWAESLQVALRLAEITQDTDSIPAFTQMFNKVQSSVNKKFWNKEYQLLADHLSPGDEPDYSVRPNQLMALTIPRSQSLVTGEPAQSIVKQSVGKLLFPWGICSLEQTHHEFHPYHDGRDEYHKDAAYHNGTIWGWNAGFTVSALNRFDQAELSYQLSKNLAKQILEQGHRGTMSENLNAYQANPEKLIETGTYAQAWSVSEYARNAQQDYIGFKPQLSKNLITLEPKLPKQWDCCNSRMTCGKNGTVDFKMRRDHRKERYELRVTGVEPSTTIHLNLMGENTKLQLVSEGNVSISVAFDIESDQWSVNATSSKWQVLPLDSYPILEGLSFAKPDLTLSHRSLQQKDYLLNKRLNEQLDIAKD